jgi:pyrrolysyl-tRNA synthetase-like protein
MGSDKKKPVKRYYRKRVELFALIEKIKLWPSRTGVLHGIRSIERHGDMAVITTHCNRRFRAMNSRNSRAARWLRNKMFIRICGPCRIPEWKLEKFNATRFHRHYGSQLNDAKQQAFTSGS